MYTNEFKAAFARIKAVVSKDGVDAGKLVFKAEMRQLGSIQRILNLYRVAHKYNTRWKQIEITPAQKEVLETLSAHNRIIVLKSRQLGITTLSGLISLDNALWNPGHNSGIMAHKRDVVSKIFESKIRTPYNYFTQDWGHYYSPQMKFDNKNELLFIHDNLGEQLNTSVSVSTSFVGSTLQFLHISEAALIENQADLINSLKTVPEGSGKIIAESTPNGRGGWFFDTWQQFKKTPDTAAYLGVFLPWWKYYPEDAVKIQYKVNSLIDWTKEEKEFLRMLPIDESHLNWRRQCVQINCNNDLDNFEEQYPTDDVSCFLAGQSSFFPATLTKILEKSTQPPKKQGLLIIDGAKVRLELDSSTPVVFIWAEPNYSHQYVIGADIGGGVGRDASAAYVLDRNIGEQVALLYGQIEPVTFGDELYKLARYYLGATICPEVNNHGIATIEQLKRLQYYNFYRRKEFDTLSARYELRIGFRTDHESKLRVTDNFKHACRRGEVILRDVQLINEMSTFVQISTKTGHSVKRQALSGSFDDRVMAVCFAWEMHKQLPEELNKQDFEEDSNIELDPDTGFPV